jgi:hypothetical protein
VLKYTRLLLNWWFLYIRMIHNTIYEIFIVFRIVLMLYIVYVCDLFNILPSFWQTFRCMVCMYVCLNKVWGLINETNLVHYLFFVYFVNFIYNLYMFQTSPGQSSGGRTVFMRHLVLVILYSWLSGMQVSKCVINTVVPPDDGPGEVQNM